MRSGNSCCRRMGKITRNCGRHRIVRFSGYFSFLFHRFQTKEERQRRVWNRVMKEKTKGRVPCHVVDDQEIVGFFYFSFGRRSPYGHTFRLTVPSAGSLSFIFYKRLEPAGSSFPFISLVGYVPDVCFLSNFHTNRRAGQQEREKEK